MNRESQQMAYISFYVRMESDAYTTYLQDTYSEQRI